MTIIKNSPISSLSSDFFDPHQTKQEYLLFASGGMSQRSQIQTSTSNYFGLNKSLSAVSPVTYFQRGFK